MGKRVVEEHGENEPEADVVALVPDEHGLDAAA